MFSPLHWEGSTTLSEVNKTCPKGKGKAKVLKVQSPVSIIQVCDSYIQTDKTGLEVQIPYELDPENPSVPKSILQCQNQYLKALNPFVPLTM